MDCGYGLGKRESTTEGRCAQIEKRTDSEYAEVTTKSKAVLALVGALRGLLYVIFLPLTFLIGIMALAVREVWGKNRVQ